MSIPTLSKRNFLTLLTAYFASSALLSVMELLLAIGWIPSFDITVVNDMQRSFTSYVLSAMSIALTLLILGSIISRREYGLSIKCKFGLVLMMVNVFSGIVTDSLYLFYNISNPIHALITSSFLLLYILGLFMFINGSPVEFKLRRFVKWTPFIPMIASLILSVALEIFHKPLLGIPQSNLVYTSISIAIFLVINQMAKREIEMS